MNSPTPALAPCPFCQAALIPNTSLQDLYVQRYGPHFQHPTNECFLSDFEVSPSYIAAWNSRNSEPTGGAALTMVQAQAEDEGLWFIAEHATEAYLQEALRRLHAAVEHDAKTIESSLAKVTPPRPTARRAWVDVCAGCQTCDFVGEGHILGIEFDPPESQPDDADWGDKTALDLAGNPIIADSTQSTGFCQMGPEYHAATAKLDPVPAGFSFADRCRLAEQCLPDAPYREMLTRLHDEMLEAVEAWKLLSESVLQAAKTGEVVREISERYGLDSDADRFCDTHCTWADHVAKHALPSVYDGVTRHPEFGDGVREDGMAPTPLTFEEWYRRYVGITLDEAKARQVSDLDTLRACWNAALDGVGVRGDGNG